MFSVWRKARSRRALAHGLYGAVVAQSRQDMFHVEWGVPDTLDGRFEMLVLHLVLAIREMRRTGRDSSELAQTLFDTALDEIAAGLREAGVGDTIVPKKLAKMSRVFYGRAKAYERDFAADDPLPVLEQTFIRNLGPDEGEEVTMPMVDAKALAAYAQAQEKHLETLEKDELMQPEKLFAPVAAPNSENAGKA